MSSVDELLLLMKASGHQSAVPPPPPSGLLSGAAGAAVGAELRAVRNQLLCLWEQEGGERWRS